MTLYRDEFEVPDELVVQLRSMFLEEINSDPEAESKYHPDDIERVKENDWFIARYLLHKELNIDDAFEMLKESLKFRNEMEINTLKEEIFPEAYLDSLLIYNQDKTNHPVVILKSKNHVKIPEEVRLQHQFIMWRVEKAIRSTEWGSIAVLLDCTDVGYKNVDMDMLMFLLNVFKHQYAWSMHVFLVYNMPWYLSAVWAIIKPFISEKHVDRIVFVNQDTIIEYIDKEQLPVSMGGTCTDPY